MAPTMMGVLFVMRAGGVLEVLDERRGAVEVKGKGVAKRRTIRECGLEEEVYTYDVEVDDEGEAGEVGVGLSLIVLYEMGIRRAMREMREGERRTMRR